AAVVLIWAIGEGSWRGYILATSITAVAGLAPIFLALGFATRLISPAPTVILLIIPAILTCIIPDIRSQLTKYRALAALLASVAILTMIVFLNSDFSLLTIVQYPQAAGQWIAANTGPNATLATTESGALAFYADRPVIDLSGKLEQIPFDKYFFI